MDAPARLMLAGRRLVRIHPWLLLLLAAPALAAPLPGECPPASDALATLTADLDGMLTTGSHTPPAAVQAFLEGKAEWLGDGATCRTWGNDDWVVKVFYADVIQSCNGTRPRSIEPAKRAAQVEYSIWVVEKLRASPRFQAWRDKVPPLFTLGPYTLVQRRARGLAMGQLSAEAKKVAEGEKAAIYAAGAAAIPGVELDLNDGNVLYTPEGRIVSWFDPAGGCSWIPDWHEGQPLVQSFWDRASALIHQRIDGTAFRPTTPKQRMGGSYGKRIEGGDLAFGDALVIANLDVAVNRAFVVKNGFRAAYDSTGRPESPDEPLGNVLGAPLDEEHGEGDRIVQHFEHGWLSWSPAEDVRVHLD